MIRKLEILKEITPLLYFKNEHGVRGNESYSQILIQLKQKRQTCSFLVFVTLLPLLGDLSEPLPGSCQGSQEVYSFASQEHTPSNGSHLEIFLGLFLYS